MQRWLVTGAAGQLGGHVVRRLVERFGAGAVVAGVNRSSLGWDDVASVRIDLSSPADVAAEVRRLSPAYVIHCGALTAVSDCFAQPDLARVINVDATRAIAEACESCGSRLVHVSTDMVFGGDRAPYREADPPAPLSVYGRTKADAERVLAGRPRTLVVRVPLMYGHACTSRQGTFAAQIAALRSGQPLRLFTDEFRTPAWTVDVAAALIGLALSDAEGVLHIAGPERLSRFEMVRRFAELLGVSAARLEPISRTSIAATEPRPADLSLDASRFAREFPDLVCGPIRADALRD